MSTSLNRSIKIHIDNSDAMAKAQTLKAEISSLEQSLKSLDAQGKKDTAGYKKQKKALEQQSQAYNSYQQQVRETERVLRNLSGATTGELYAVRKVLRKEMREAGRGTDAYREKLKLYNQVQKEITVSQKEMNGQFGAQATLMSKMGGGIRKYIGVATAFIASVTGMAYALRRVTDAAADMDDTYADVMKTTGLTREEVLELNEELKRMDTRTSREQLNLLARDAGKLGIEGKQDILDFVEAANIIQVALGEDLGEDAIKSIGKMSEVFQKATKELDGLGLKERMLSIGSAVNEVAQSSSASEPYLVSFAGRLGGVASQAGIGIDKILGFASALDQDMQSVEMSATTLQKFIMTIMSKPAEFAQIAKMEVGAFTDLLKNDANDAIKLVLRSLNEQGGFQDLIPIFEEMGLSGTRAVGVLSSMASSIDKIDEAQSIANKSMIEATGAIDEYNIKNENAAAIREKNRKAISDISEEIGQKLLPAMQSSSNVFIKILKGLPTLFDFFIKWGPLLVKTVAVIAAYNTVLKANVMWKKLMQAETIKLHFLILREQAATTLLALKYVFASRSAAQLAASSRALFATLSLNPFALLVTAVAALTYGLWKMSKESANLLTKQVALINVSKEAAKSIANEKSELDLLLSVARNERVSKEERLIAIKKLNKISPEYLGNLDLENINTDKARVAIDKYTEALMENAKQKAIAEKVSELYTKKMDAEIRKTEAMALLEKELGDDAVAIGMGLSRRKRLDRVKAELKDIENELIIYQEMYDNLFENKKSSGKDDTGNDSGGSDDDTPASPGVTSVNQDKDIYKEKLAVLDAYLVTEKNKLLQARYEGTINQEQYLRQLEQLEMDGLQKKMDIYELDSEQQIGVQNLIYEKKIAIMQQLIEDEKTYQQKLLDIQIKADQARAEQNWATLKLIAKQNETDAKEAFDEQQKHKQDMMSIGIDMSTEMGTLVGSFITGNGDMVASALKSMINMALDVLKIQVEMAMVGVTVQGLATSMLDPTALARAAIKIALIEAAFAGVKAVVSSAISGLGSGKPSATITNDALTGQRVVTQRRDGKYDVLGADDGRLYSGVPYAGDARTGVVSTPTLMGEYGGELVVNAPDFKALQRHVNYPLVLQAIQQSRQPHSVPQRADGNYSNLPQNNLPQNDNYLVKEMIELLNYMKSNPMKAYVVLSELQAKQTLQETSQKIGSKR